MIQLLSLSILLARTLATSGTRSSYHYSTTMNRFFPRNVFFFLNVVISFGADYTVFQFFRILTTLSDESLFVSSFARVCVQRIYRFRHFIRYLSDEQHVDWLSWSSLQISYSKERERERDLWWETLRESALIFIADVPNPEQPLLFSSGRDSFIDIRGAPFLSRFSRVETSSCSLYGVITRASG